MNINLGTSIYLHIVLCAILVRNSSTIVVPESKINTSQVATSRQVNPKLNSQPSNISILIFPESSQLDPESSNNNTVTDSSIKFNSEFFRNDNPEGATSSQPNIKSTQSSSQSYNVSSSTALSLIKFHPELYRNETSESVTSIKPNSEVFNVSTSTVATTSQLNREVSNISTSTVPTSNQLTPKSSKDNTLTNPLITLYSTESSRNKTLESVTPSQPTPANTSVAPINYNLLAQFYPKTSKNVPSSEPKSKPSNAGTPTVTTSNNYNLELFTMNTSSKFNADLIQQLQCVRYFVYTFMTYDSKRITVLVNENEESGILYAYISQLQYSQVDKQLKLSSYILDFSNLNVKKTEFLANNVVIILQQHDSIRYLSIDLNDLCSHDCKFAIFLTGNYTEKNSFTEEAKKLVEFMWIKKVSNVVVIAQVAGTFLAAESNYFKPDSLPEPMEPTVIGKCTKKLWRVDKPLYSAMKMNNCSVNIGYFNEKLYSQIVVENNKKTVKGLEVSMIDAIAQSLNFTAYLVMMKWDGKITKVEAAVEKFKKNDTVDLIIGNIHCHENDNNECTVAFESSSLVWLVPIKARFSLTGLIAPLETKIWIAIGVVALYTIFFKLLLFKKMSFLEILALFLGAAWYKQPQRLSYRFKFMSLIIFGFILVQYYSASLSSSLFTGSHSKLSTVEDLLNSTFGIGGQSYLIELFEYDELDDFNEHNNDKKKIYNKFVGLDLESYNKKLYDTMSGKDSSMALIVMLNISSFETQFNPEYVYTLPESLITLSLGFSVRPDLTYFSEIDRVLLNLIESGIIGAMGRKLSPIIWFQEKDEESTNSEDFIGFENLLPCFLLLIAGNILSFFCFLCEIIKFKHQSYFDNQRLERSDKKRKNIMIKKTKKQRHLTLKEQKILFNDRLSKQNSRGYF